MPAMPENKGPEPERAPARIVNGPDPAGRDQRPVAAAGANLVFLREDEIRLAQDLLFFAYRDFTNAADVILEELGFGRAHHRTLHFIGRNPGITVSDLLTILRITKQSLARVLGALMEQGYVAQAQGHADRRQRLLTLTAAGQALERRLFDRQRERLTAAYREAGGTAVDGFRRVMRAIMGQDARDYLDRAERDGRSPRT
jgi:DNA-binding MarR family transcriptional regulator